jgi:hypothetical protein
LLPWASERLEILDAACTYDCFTDKDCEMAELRNLTYLDAGYTKITNAGVKTVLAAMKARGSLQKFMIQIDGCSEVDRSLKRKAEEGTLELARALGL